MGGYDWEQKALPARVKPLKPRARVEAKHVGSQRSAQPSKDAVQSQETNKGETITGSRQRRDHH
eukprot:2128241-Amphidinium_carterae.1